MQIKEKLRNFFFMPNTDWEGWPALMIHVVWISFVFGALFGELIPFIRVATPPPPRWFVYGAITCMFSTIAFLVVMLLIVGIATLLEEKP